MPTKREQEILALIRQNPMISQKEMADILGITRPGVASHISHLIKEGLISGKGYVLPHKEYITVIGATNMDIYGIIQTEEVPKSSNSGTVKLQLGGIGRNIAANLASLGVNVNLITVFGNDLNGNTFKEDALKRGINLAYAEQLLTENTSNYLYINRKDGERVIGVDDMGINRHLTPNFLKSRLPGINASNLVIFDSNIPKETISWLYDYVTVPMIAKAVSVNKAPNLLQPNVNLTSLIINGVEAELIAKQTITSPSEAKLCAQKLATLFQTDIYLYVDELGLIFASKNMVQYYPYDENVVVCNTNGVGAAMAAMVAYTKLKQASIPEPLPLVLQAGELTMQTDESVAPYLPTN
ncbi:PfkB family carbohydrate kinase [Ligilactobacillus equi]|uniref:HTH domain protein n=1 Tax=Ligilactobacillus equi DPC 6820 TaxID=1392007 RepID=V7HZ69_9LACO|nr:PfkB family carbohydrate kinase [Ligilactobacillus equi]ETA74326.1 HTH domain protein [Ligilactobacillus equi DPC 6820]